MDDVAMPFLLLSAFRGMVDAVHARLDDAGFSGVRATHGFAMQALGDGCSSVELGERLGVSKQAAAKTAAGLEELGFLAREPHPVDGRVRVLVPTARGREMLRLSGEAFTAEVGRWRAAAGDDAVDTTLRALAVTPWGPRGASDFGGWL
ncbi:MarR family winged helix-turn-helix transcriptional regulator [Gordonia sp. FQ]|uniref:MarR family winged helix-turn-helix transcriptional regulator n=1 Tax=Gordonia sp. FQ TaxID=3446634 RepID=UPI003F83AC39